jgi:hypothetical protein
MLPVEGDHVFLQLRCPRRVPVTGDHTSICSWRVSAVREPRLSTPEPSFACRSLGGRVAKGCSRRIAVRARAFRVDAVVYRCWKYAERYDE